MNTGPKNTAAYRHEDFPLGKTTIESSVRVETVGDLAMAYSPGVAQPCLAIAKNPDDAYRFTGKGNLVAIISDGSSILHLGNLGSLASKPVMEGKVLLFRRLAKINALDIQVNTSESAAFIDTVVRIADTFGGIHLDGIAESQSLEIEQTLIARCDIPVFSDEPHGMAIVVVASLLTALKVQGKKLKDVRIVCGLHGHTAVECVRLLLSLGAHKSRIVVTTGCVRTIAQLGQTVQNGLTQHSPAAMKGSDVFIGVADPDWLTPEAILSMASNPIVFAYAGPYQAILPWQAREIRTDLILATDSFDHPNELVSCLASPFVFRGALDVRARCINEAMKIAAIRALHLLALQPVPLDVLRTYNVDRLVLGKDYIVPKPLDGRLHSVVAGAVARAAIDSGEARISFPAHYPSIYPFFYPFLVDVPSPLFDHGQSS